MPAEVGFELVVAGFFLPPLMVGGGQFVGSGLGGVEDRRQHHDEFPGAVAAPSGTSYSMTAPGAPAPR